MDNTVSVDTRQGVKDVPEYRLHLCIGGRPTVKKCGQGQGHVWEDEREAVLVVAEGLQEGDAWLLQQGEDFGFADGVVRLDAVGLRYDLEGAVFMSVDLSRDAAGDVLTVPVRAYPLPSFLVGIVIIASGSNIRRL